VDLGVDLGVDLVVDLGVDLGFQFFLSKTCLVDGGASATRWYY